MQMSQLLSPHPHNPIVDCILVPVVMSDALQAAMPSGANFEFGMPIKKEPLQRHISSSRMCVTAQSASAFRMSQVFAIEFVVQHREQLF